MAEQNAWSLSYADFVDTEVRKRAGGNLELLSPFLRTTRGHHLHITEHVLKFLENEEDLFSHKSFKLNSFANCSTTFVVYRLECECGCFYTFRTKRRFRDRLSEHKNAIVTQNPNYPMAMHYKAAKHLSPSSLRVLAVKVILFGFILLKL